MSTIAHPGGAGLPDDNQGPRILAATSIVTAGAAITVLARMYVRIFLIRNVGVDVSVVFCLVYTEIDCADQPRGLYHAADHDLGKSLGSSLSSRVVSAILY